MNGKKLNEIKKVLMSEKGYIRIGSHTKKRLRMRGYTKGDIVSCIMKGRLCEVQYGYNHTVGRSVFSYVVEGKDSSHNPIVVVLSEEGQSQFLVVTVMPPIDRNRFFDCIG